MSRIFAFAVLTAVGCTPASDKPAANTENGAVSISSRSDKLATPHRIAAKHLPNLVQVHAKVICGGLPEGEDAFHELRAMGVKTIISVDGLKPDIEMARKFGLRYVHLPHGYDGVPENRIEELAKAVRELEGPIYIHCHHGKHRSPAAASVACVAAGLIPGSGSVAVLELAGTSPNYRGLFESVRNAKPLSAKLLDELKVDFPESAEIPRLTEAMVELDDAHDQMNAIAAAGWRSPPSILIWTQLTKPY